jgi:hypothetical protein
MKTPAAFIQNKHTMRDYLHCSGHSRCNSIDTSDNTKHPQTPPVGAGSLQDRNCEMAHSKHCSKLTAKKTKRHYSYIYIYIYIYICFKCVYNSIKSISQLNKTSGAD